MSRLAPSLLAPVGRAEPDDVQGWIEQGGLLALQMALALPPARLRQRLTGVERRDGAGKLAPRTGDAIHLTVGEGRTPARFLVEEIPAWVIGGALLLALACEQPTLTLHVSDGRPRSLLREMVQRMAEIGLVGERGWLRGIHLSLTSKTGPADALDPLTAHLLTSVVTDEREPDITLLTINAAHIPHEVPLGQSLAALLTSLDISPFPDHLVLGERRVDRVHYQTPLTFEQFGRALGSGRLTLPPP